MSRAHAAYCPKIANVGDTFAPAFNILFQPSHSVAKRLVQMERNLGLLSKMGSPSTEFIAMHARVCGVISSAKGVSGWKDHVRLMFATTDDAPEMVDCARTKRSKFLGKNLSFQSDALPVVFFSNDLEFKTESMRIDPSLMYLNDTLTFHIDKSTGDSDTVTKGNIDAVTEYYLLSRASCIIGSSITFSGSASPLMHGRMGNSCYFFFKKCDTLIPDFWSLTEPPFILGQ